eukprot:TRINITY_DN8709_c0_g1_i1.p1 TRINITY_DN8709_c0_g1~~TRINITY_DN8709_c0_g1_i1.p1  ORF type:complete len:551 (+),score=51.24 TRINITY_DN8709_c0_g1_i1:135-1655(+)
MEIHFLNAWPVVSSQFPLADVLLIINDRECDLLYNVISQISRTESRRYLLWCQRDDVFNEQEKIFIKHSPTMAHPKDRVVSQWREVAACALLAQEAAIAYTRITRLRYDLKLCRLNASALPADALALQPTSVFDVTGEFLVHDHLLTGPSALMFTVFRFYDWILNPLHWDWWGSTLISFEPRRTNHFTGMHPRSGPDVETLLKYYLFTRQVPVRRVHYSVLYAGKGRLGAAACPEWPQFHRRGWPMWQLGEPVHCRMCWTFDGAFAAALAEFVQRGNSGKTTVIDLGSGLGTYAKSLLRAGVAVVAVDTLDPGDMVLGLNNFMYFWSADITGILNPRERIWRLVAYRDSSDLSSAAHLGAVYQGAVWNVSEIDLKFDWALALGIDHLPPRPIARNIALNAHGVVVAGSEAWLNDLSRWLPFERDYAAERWLRLFAGTTSCCTHHRTLRVYSSRATPTDANTPFLSRWMYDFDPWRTLAPLEPLTATFAWLQVLRGQQLEQSNEERL